jgi:hypothetical protein
MADLAEALDAALTARYRPLEVKTPATTRRGLIARMNQLEKHHAQPGDRGNAAGRRAAASAGIHPDTWVRWRGNQRPPGEASIRRLEAAYVRQITVPGFRKALKSKGVPRLVRITATIRWSSSPQKMYNAQSYRSTTLEGMREAMVATIRAWVQAGPEAAAQAFESGTARVYKTDEVAFEGDAVIIEFP